MNEKIREERRWVGRRGELYVATQVLLFGLIGAAPWLTAAHQGAPPWWVALPALALLLVGGLGSLVALKDLGRNLSVLPHPKEGADLVTEGAYGWVRHPIYAFVLALGAGWALGWRSPPAGLGWVLLFTLFDLKARREERLLELRFPAYTAYRKRVKRLIPWLY